jgi:hypothetical protein
MAETETIHDPFLGRKVEISTKLTDRLQGKYAMGPHMPNGAPEFGWRQFQAPPIQHEAAKEIERLRGCIAAIQKATVEGRVCDDVAWFDGITTLFDFCDMSLNPGDE